MQIICLVLVLLVELAVGKADIDALLELKKGIQTDTSTQVLVSWDSKSLESNGCPKNWFGISCSNGHVTSISLNNLGLAGEFSFPAISPLQMLQNLSLSSNQLAGTLTNDVGLLESLQNLDLSNNLFSGSVPNQLTSLKTLVLVNISLNKMGGEIPSGFGNLKQLKYLDLHSNGFVGDVMSLLGELGAVAYVDLSCNGFSGPLDLGIGDPDFMSSVTYLNISCNNLTGELFFPHDGIPYLDSLEVFDVSENHITGKLPSFSLVVSLRVMKLRSNQLSGSLPGGLLQESSMVLSELDLSHNQLEGPIESISSLNLRYLNLSSNSLSGPLPLRIAHCATIDLSNNMFSGNLSRAQSWGNYVEVIDLSSNDLIGSFPNQTSQFLRLMSLRISNNSLEGVLPPLLGTYPELKVVDFSLNKLSGFLPFLFNSTKFVDINLSSNNFSGTVPTDGLIPQNYSLLSLNLSHNSLSGQLPPELGRFGSMVCLDLSNNLLEGGIPDDFPDTIAVFDVSYNNLSGVVPRSLQKFPSSSFHPGNELLILPNEATSSPKGGGNSSGRGRGSRMKSAVRAALIAGLVGGALMIAILSVVIYCRVHQERNKSTSIETGGKKVLSSAAIESNTLQRDDSSALQGLKNLDHPESTRKAEVVAASITSMASSGNNSPHQSEIPSALKVCSPEKLAGDLHLFNNSLKFSPEELSSAPAEPVGMSCHGTLYKAMLSSGHVLAVKLLKEGIAKGRKEFAREAKKLGNIRHPNLVSLQGFYWGPREHEKLIISKYIDAPCLALCLHGTDPRTLPPLYLDERLKIALDLARCLTHLHTESAIPHGNLKSTNILIELPNINVLLTDYSLHRLLTAAGTAEQVLNAGALGYLPPEFTSMSKPCPSMKSDVYAFGIILLELLTGRSSADIIPGNPEVVDLAEWVSFMAVENRAIECFDSQILGVQTAGSLPKNLDGMLHVALKCTLPAAERPDMKMVFEELSSLLLS